VRMCNTAIALFGIRPVRLVPEALFPEFKLLKREVDHSLPSNAEVKNARSYTSPPLHIFINFGKVKRRHKFPLLLVTREGNQKYHVGPIYEPSRMIIQ
jgi:hypothetical protein